MHRGVPFGRANFEEDKTHMVRLAIILLIISLVFAVLDFTGIAASFAGHTKLFFYVFIALFTITAIAKAFREKKLHSEIVLSWSDFDMKGKSR